MNTKITVIDVSGYFINEAIKKNKPLTVMQALKLTYIAQGFHLALTEAPFFEEEIQAWKYGPVVKKLYEHLKKIKNKDHHTIEEEQDINAKFDEKQVDILNVVFKKYARLEAWDLSELTHKSGSPWDVTYSEKPHGTISHNLIKDHFKKIVTEYSFAILLSEVS